MWRYATGYSSGFRANPFSTDMDNEVPFPPATVGLFRVARCVWRVGARSRTIHVPHPVPLVYGRLYRSERLRRTGVATLWCTLLQASTKTGRGDTDQSADVWRRKRLGPVVLGANAAREWAFSTTDEPPLIRLPTLEMWSRWMNEMSDQEARMCCSPLDI